MPAPPSVLALPPMAKISLRAPASSAAAMTCPNPVLEAVSGASTPPGSRTRPQASASSTTAVPSFSA